MTSHFVISEGLRSLITEQLRKFNTSLAVFLEEQVTNNTRQAFIPAEIVRVDSDSQFIITLEEWPKSVDFYFKVLT